MRKVIILYTLVMLSFISCKNPLVEGVMTAYEKPEYTVQVGNASGGTVTVIPAKDKYSENEQINIEAVADGGYEFKGWQGGMTGEENPTVVKVTEDMWIIPRFEASPNYRLTTEWSPAGGILYYSYDGIFNTTVSKTNFLYGEQCAVRAFPMPGYQFDRWEGDIESANDTIYITFDRNYQVYPKFSIIPSLVTYTLTGGVQTGGVVEYLPAKTEYYENEVVMVTAKPDSGYIFSQWSGDHTGTEISFNLTMDSNKNVTPSFIKREWTFMVYMAADNDLDNAALDDFNELEAVDYSGKPVSVLALIDRVNSTSGNWSDTRLYEVKTDPGGKNAIVNSARLDGRPELNIPSGSNSELDTSSRFTLSGFIDYAKRVYKADNYGLIVWGYGLGWKGYAIDNTSGSSMPLSWLGNAVEGKGIAVIGFDTGFGVTLESAYELRNSAAYLVGSPGADIDPEKGWDYQALFAGFLSKASRTAKAFCDSAVDQFRQQYGAVNGAAISVVDSSKTGSLFTAFEGFSGALAGTLTESGAKNTLYAKLLNGTVSLYYDGSGYPADAYADLYSISLQGSDTGLQSALGAAVSSWSKDFGETRALMGVFVNSLTSNGVFATSHAAGYKKSQGTIKFVIDSGNYVPSGNTTGTSLLDRLFYFSY